MLISPERTTAKNSNDIAKYNPWWIVFMSIEGCNKFRTSLNLSLKKKCTYYIKSLIHSVDGNKIPTEFVAKISTIS